MANDLNSLVAQTSSFSSSMNSAAVASGKAAGGVLDLGKAAFNALNPISKIGNAIGGWRQAIGFIGFGGIIHELEKAKNVLGDIEQAAIGVTRSMGPMKDYPMWQAEIVKGATQLGIEYNEYAQAIQAANKHHAALSMSQKEFLGFTKDAARFGEMVGASASEGAAAFGKLVGESKVGMGVIKNVQHEMLALQNAVGLTGHEMIELLNTGLTPIITQLKLLGESDALINRTTAAVTKLSAQFMAAGFEAGKAAGLVQKLMDPERLTENVMLFNQMGININDAIGAMTGGGGADEMIAKMGDKLPELAKKVASMGMAGVQFAKSLGIPYKDLLQMQNMSSAEAQKAMAAQQAEREKQDQFNKQWEQTMSTWKKWAISLSQAFDQIAIAIMDAFGVKNFKDIKELPLAFGRVFVDFLNAIKFKEIVAIAINVLRMFSQGLQKLMEVIKPALDRLFSGERFQMLSNAVNKLGASFGTMFAKIIDKLPALIDGISKMITYITPWIEQMVNLVAENPKGAIIAILVAKFGGFIMPMIGSMVMQLLPQLMKGAGQLLWSGLKMAGRGLLSAGSGAMNFGGIAGTSVNAAGGLTTAAGAASAAGIVGGVAGGVYGLYRAGSNISDAMDQGHDTGVAIKRGLLDTLQEPGAMAGVGAAIGTLIAPGIGTAVGAAVGGTIGFIAMKIGEDAVRATQSTDLLATSTENLLALSNKLKENIDSIKTPDLKKSIEEQNEYLRLQKEAEATFSTTNDRYLAGLAAKRIAEAGGYQGLSQEGKAELLSKQGIAGFASTEANFQKASGVNPEKRWNTDSIVNIQGFQKADQIFAESLADSEKRRQQNLDMYKNSARYKESVTKAVLEQQKKDMERMDAAVKQTFEPYEKFRENLMDQVRKGLIDPKVAMDKLQESKAAMKLLGDSIQTQITQISSDASGLNGVFSSISSYISDFLDHPLDSSAREQSRLLRSIAQEQTQSLLKNATESQLAELRDPEKLRSTLASRISNEAGTAGIDMSKQGELLSSIIADSTKMDMQYRIRQLQEQRRQEGLNAAASEELRRLMATTAHNTGRGADAAEKTAINTTPRRPVRMINLNEVAMRANESGANTLTFSRG